MTTDRNQIEVKGTAVEVVRKEIKNLHVGVYPLVVEYGWLLRCA